MPNPHLELMTEEQFAAIGAAHAACDPRIGPPAETGASLWAEARNHEEQAARAGDEMSRAFHRRMADRIMRRVRERVLAHRPAAYVVRNGLALAWDERSRSVVPVDLVYAAEDVIGEATR